MVLVVTLLTLINVPEGAAQPGFNKGDVVTFADSRDLTAVDFTEREVFFATNNGLWRVDRMTGKLLEPEFSGYGLGQTYHFGRISTLLFHWQTATLWLVTANGLYVRSLGIDEWKNIYGYGEGITRLGERNDTLFIQAKNRLSAIAVFGYRDLGDLDDFETDGIRWSTDRSQKKSKVEMPFYHSVDPLLRFEPDQGRLVDWDLASYKSSFRLIDPDFSKSYIGFPGLGIAIADDRRGSIELFQPGPVGRGIRAIALAENGIIYLGGESDKDGDGLNRFDRKNGVWDRFGRRQRWGLETKRIYDLAYHDGKLFAATEDGLLIGSPRKEGWGMYGLLEGAPKPPVWLVERVGEWLFIGGSNGIRMMMIPGGPFFDAKGPGGADLYAADAVADGDTLWLVGPQGVFKGGPEMPFELIGGDAGIDELPTRAIAVTSQTVAVGGSDGLSFFDRRSHQWREMPSRTHFEEGQITAIVARNDHFYIGTDQGLYQYNDRTGKLLLFGTDLGLPDERVEKLLIEEDTLWVGTRAGLSRLNLNAPYWR